MPGLDLVRETSAGDPEVRLRVAQICPLPRQVWGERQGVAQEMDTAAPGSMSGGKEVAGEVKVWGRLPSSALSPDSTPKSCMDSNPHPGGGGGEPRRDAWAPFVTKARRAWRGVLGREGLEGQVFPPRGLRQGTR